MNKIAGYLQEHLQGEVSTNAALRAAFSHDMSILEMMPEMIVYPRVTNDIRKVMRFVWQLAEKGHVLPVTPRGGGTDTTGAAIGKGIIISTPAHMNEILEFDGKQRLIRLQPGVSAKSLQTALVLHGITIPSLIDSSSRVTIGGAVAGNITNRLSATVATIQASTQQLEVVLSNGDVLQTERLSKRDLSKRKGLQTFEGEIYRSLDNLIEDNKELIEQRIGTDTADNSGYSSIAQVKRRDGSFDLTPLFIGSQGSLGVVSELIIKAEFSNLRYVAAAMAFPGREAARDALDTLRAFQPAFLEYFDGAFFKSAAQYGKKYDFYQNAEAAVVLIGFNDFNERVRRKKLQKVIKQFSKQDVVIDASEESSEADELLAALDVGFYGAVPNEMHTSSPPLFDGAFIPAERFEEFQSALDLLGEKHRVALPIHYQALDSTVYSRPILSFQKVGDKQKVFKLLDEFSALVTQYGGSLIGTGGEGRVKTRFAQSQLEDDVRELYASVKAIFDPYTLLNPGVKQTYEIRELVSLLRSDYDTAATPDDIVRI
jgi:FAD/FMN-containing dehydrogenase